MIILIHGCNGDASILGITQFHGVCFLFFRVQVNIIITSPIPLKPESGIAVYSVDPTIDGSSTKSRIDGSARDQKKIENKIDEKWEYCNNACLYNS